MPPIGRNSYGAAASSRATALSRRCLWRKPDVERRGQWSDIDDHRKDGQQSHRTPPLSHPPPGEHSTQIWGEGGRKIPLLASTSVIAGSSASDSSGCIQKSSHSSSPRVYTARGQTTLKGCSCARLPDDFVASSETGSSSEVSARPDEQASCQLLVLEQEICGDRREWYGQYGSLAPNDR